MGGGLEKATRAARAVWRLCFLSPSLILEVNRLDGSLKSVNSHHEVDGPEEDYLRVMSTMMPSFGLYTGAVEGFSQIKRTTGEEKGLEDDRSIIALATFFIW